MLVYPGGSSKLARYAEGLGAAGAHDVLRVRLEDNPDDSSGQRKAALIPFVKEIVPVVNQPLRLLEITPPEGLIEATTTVMKERSRGRRQ